LRDERWTNVNKFSSNFKIKILKFLNVLVVVVLLLVKHEYPKFSSEGQMARKSGQFCIFYSVKKESAMGEHQQGSAV
jgi:hypothetical protein